MFRDLTVGILSLDFGEQSVQQSSGKSEQFSRCV